MYPFYVWLFSTAPFLMIPSVTNLKLYPQNYYDFFFTQPHLLLFFYYLLLTPLKNIPFFSASISRQLLLNRQVIHIHCRFSNLFLTDSLILINQSYLWFLLTHFQWLPLTLLRPHYPSLNELQAPSDLPSLLLINSLIPLFIFFLSSICNALYIS